MAAQAIELIQTRDMSYNAGKTAATRRFALWDDGGTLGTPAAVRALFGTTVSGVDIPAQNSLFPGEVSIYARSYTLRRRDDGSGVWDLEWSYENGGLIQLQPQEIGYTEFSIDWSAEFREAWSLLGVDEAQDFLVVLDGSDEAFLGAHLTAEPRQKGCEDGVAFFLGQGGVSCSAKNGGFSAALGLFLFNVGGGFFDELQGEFVALASGFSPVDQTVLAHNEAVCLRVFLAGLLHGEAEFEAGAHPWDVNDLVTVNFLGDFNAVRTCGDGDGRVWMRVVHMGVGDEAVERRVDRRRARIQIESRVRIHAHHIVLGLAFEAFVGAARVDTLEVDEFGLVERGEIFLLRGAEVAAGALDPEHFDVLSGERVGLSDFRGGVAAAGVRDALVGAEAVRAVDEFLDRAGKNGVRRVPVTGDMHQGFHGVGFYLFFIDCPAKPN